MAKGDVIQDRDLIERIDKALANKDTTAEEFYLLAGEAFEKCTILGEIRRYNTMLDPKGHLWASPEARKRAIAIESLYHPIREYTRKDFSYANEKYYINEFRPALTEFSNSTKHLWALGEEAPNALRPKEKLENGYTMFMEGWSKEKIEEWEEDELREMYEDTFCENRSVIEKIIADWKQNKTIKPLFHERYIEYIKTPHEKPTVEDPEDKSPEQRFYEDLHLYMQELRAHPELLDSPPKAFPSPKSKKQQWKFPFGIFKKRK